VAVIDQNCRSGKMRANGACVGGAWSIAASAGSAPSPCASRPARKRARDAVRLWQASKNIDLDVKSIVVASGITDAQPPKGLHGYDVYDNVITYLQFERLMMPAGLRQAILSGRRTRSTPTKLRGFSARAEAWIMARPTAPRYAAWSPTTGDHHEGARCVCGDDHLLQ